MTGKGKLIALTSLVLLFQITSISHAAYFIFEKKGNVRSGPGTRYRIIGQLAKGTIAQIPASFKTYEAKWLPIDTKAEQGEKVVYTKWVHRSIGTVIRGEMEDVDKYLAIRESGWPEETQELILDGKVELGMNTHMVFYAWGRPDSIKEKKMSDGVREQWAYKKQGSRTQYLFFENGLLRSMEE
jgi:hypothetical protein